MAGHFHNMVRSTFDFSLYGEVTAQPARRTAGYFALLVVALSVVLSLATVFHLRTTIRRDVEPELHKLPTIIIKDHVASAPNVEQPWVWSFATEGQPKSVVVIDTTDQVTDFKPDEAQGIILNRTRVTLRNMQHPVPQSIDLSEIDDVTLDAAWARKWLNASVWIAGGSLLVLRPIYHAGAKLLAALILSLVGLVVSSSRKRPLRYGQLFTIALYALTPAILIETVFDVVNVDLPHFWVLYLIVGAVYTGMATRKVPDDDPALPSVVPSMPPSRPL